jgi:biotin carboxylase
LPGNPVEAIKNARNKALMRNILAQVGVRQPHFVVARDIPGITDGIRRLGLPLVLKPADDTGSNNVLLCQTGEQAERHAERILAHQVNMRGQRTAGVVLAEEYIEAAEFSVEMLTWQGETHCIGITQKSLTGFPYFVEVHHLFPALLSMEQAESIRATVRQALSALGIRNGITHTEVKWTPAGCMIIEVNPRPAGGMIPELVRLVTGIDMLEQYIRCAVDGPMAMQIRMQGVAGIQFLIADRQGVLQTCAGIERAANMADVVLVKMTVPQGSSVRPPQNAYHRLGYVIVHSEDATIAQQRLQEAISQIHLSIES